MEEVDLIPAEDFCIHHHISYIFISTLHEAGIIEVVAEDEQKFLQAAQLKDIEKLIRLYAELEINMEGIETIAHLLKRMSNMQEQLRSLQQRLRFYEDDDGV